MNAHDLLARLRAVLQRAAGLPEARELAKDMIRIAPHAMLASSVSENPTIWAALESGATILQSSKAREVLRRGREFAAAAGTPIELAAEPKWWAYGPHDSFWFRVDYSDRSDLIIVTVERGTTNVTAAGVIKGYS